MDRKIINLFFFIMFVSCSKNENIITSYRIGKYILGSELIEQSKEEAFDIKTDFNNKIISILCSSKKYKTSEGFGVGSNINFIKQKTEITSNDIKMSKGSSRVGTLGLVYIYQNIAFIDQNLDNLVDYVWIEKK